MRVLKENYAKNVEIAKENLKRGMNPSDLIRTANAFRKQLEDAGMMDEDGKEFINALLELVDDETHMVVRVA